MSNEHSYERLCDYYRAKQREIDKQGHECKMVAQGGMLLSNPPKQKYVCEICGKHKYKKYK